jgi:hypothetical protein
MAEALSPERCFIEVMPQGVVQWGARQTAARPDDPADQLETRLFRQLLARPASLPWRASRDLAQLLPGAGIQAARAMFRLKSRGAIGIRQVPPADDALPAIGLQRDLQALVDRGAEAVLLTDGDGLVLAQRWAFLMQCGGELVNQRSLQFEMGEGLTGSDTRCALHLRQAGGLDAPALVQLARRLVRTWGRR